MKSIPKILAVLVMTSLALASAAVAPRVDVRSRVVPVLAGIDCTITDCLTVSQVDAPFAIAGCTLDLSGTTDLGDIKSVGIYAGENVDSLRCVGRACHPRSACVTVDLDYTVAADSTRLWIGVALADSVSLNHKVAVKCDCLTTAVGSIAVAGYAALPHRVGAVLHRKNADGVVSTRIPGLATAADGSLIAIYDARYNSSRDLQGDIDIVMRRSTDGGSTWTPMQRVLDMGCYGGLPEKYNGVSDGCIVVDDVTGRVYVAGLWMHGLLDNDGRPIKNLTNDSTVWAHQWKGRASQPGLDPLRTCQFIISSSDDNGVTWSGPVNITAAAKRPEWWLYAPAPGHGITMSDGTIVIPSQGRDATGMPFSNITYSTDRGVTWTASNPAYDNVTECNVAQLSTGELMLNMRDNRNRGRLRPNGRRVCTTADLGSTWIEHPTSRKALTEPTCMGSLHRHEWTDAAGARRHLLLFANPDHYKQRKNLTLKASIDDGATWPEDMQLLFDETKGWGYSSIASVDDRTIGILYESGLADMVFITVGIDELLPSEK